MRPVGGGGARIRATRLAVRSLILALATGACTRGENSQAGRVPTLALINGLWFAGDRFEARTMYVVDGVFRTIRPDRVDSTADLGGGFVVAPYGEAHNHWLEPKLIGAYNEQYLLDGVFYVMDQGNGVPIRRAIDSVVNRPTSVDFRSANQGWTGPGGHPLEILDQMIALGAIPRTASDRTRDDYVFVVTSDSAIESRWQLFLDGRPDFVKVFLIYSDEYARRVNDDRVGKHRGMDPRLLPGIVRRARPAGLPVHAHVATAADFRTAIADSVDQVVHLPFFDSKRGVKISLIDPADVKLAAERGVEVIPTVAWVEAENRDTAVVSSIYRDLMVPNLRTLDNSGVTLLVGSDQFRRSSAIEAGALARTGVFTNAKLLRMWTETTPRAIFPNRRIGRFEDGFEASFLVLDGDPLQDFSKTASIRLRMKQGRWLHPRADSAIFPPLPGG